jgi:hypothetical protein
MRNACRRHATIPGRFTLLCALLCLSLPAAARAQPAPAPAQPPPTSPLQIRSGDTDFRIGGFVDAGAVVRSTNTGNGMATAFGSIPFENTPQGNLHETRLSAQNSRLNLLVNARAGSAAVRGFLEIDFFGAGPANAFVYTNSHTPRLRNAWVQYMKGKFEFTGGQVWTLLTPNRNGLSPVSADVVTSQNLDINLQLGLPWSRPNQFRFVVHPTRTFAAGISIENPQPFVGGAVVLPTSFPATEVDNGSNPGAPSPYPDIVGKVAFDPQTGNTRQHIEAAVLVRGFQTYNPATDRTFSATGTGFSLGAVLEPVRNLRLIGNALTSDGGGRYMIGQAPDFMVNADASIGLIGSTSALGGVEWQVRPMTMIFGYFGTVRIDQRVASDGTRPIGYGVPGNTAANKSIDEATAGFNHAFFREPRYGALSLIAHYSYVTRKPWSVPDATPSTAHLHMVYVTARYTLP